MVKGKTCIVTGATSGIGRSTAIALARAGAELGIVCRDAGRGEETVRAIRDQTGSTAVDVFLADLSSQAAIRGVASAILARYPQIHLLVNNAGVVNLQRAVTADGIEQTFAVNHLAYFLLTLLLLDRLRASAPARIVNVGSDAHKFVSGIDFDDVGFARGYKSMKVYGHSKLANLLFTTELARRLEGSGVTVNCVHPGAVATGLGKNNGRVAGLLIRMLAPFFRTPDKGAATTLHVATSPALDGISGRYFANCREVQPSAAARDRAAAQRLWELSAHLTGLDAPGLAGFA
ncbi:SDR family oxidoreductase [Candidatus Binatia bacterium]|nr:SDR family oxidoreductase [Candidatus Binatia bacterium]